MMRNLLSLALVALSFAAFAQPANDDCANAQFLSMGGPEICIPTLGDNTGASGSDITPGCAQYAGAEVWFTVVVPSTGIAIIETSLEEGGITDTGIAVYEGSCDDLVLIECDDDGSDAPGLFSKVELTGLTPGTQLFIAVWRYFGTEEGAFNICAYQPPVCPNIEAATFETDSVSEDYISLTWQSFSPGSTFFIEYGEQGFELGTGTQVTGVTGTDGPPVEFTGLELFTFYDFYLWAECDAENSTDTISDTFNTSPGILTNDDCENAINLPVNGPADCQPTIGFNDGATDSGVAHSCAFYQGGDVWYSFVAPSTGEVFIETSFAGGFTDGGLALYSGDCTTGLTEIECNDDGNDDPDSQLFSLIEAYDLNPGETYYAAVWEFGGNAEGAFNICVYAPPTCPNPELFSFFPDSLSSTDAFIEWDEINIGATYIIEYGLDGFEPGTGMTVTGIIGEDGPPAQISGLDPDTTYDYYFQAACAPGDSSEVLGPFGFTTLETCQSSSQFEIQLFNVGVDFASFTWPSYNPGATFIIEYDTAGFAIGTGNVVTGTVGVDGPPVTLQGLLLDTDYDFYLQEACDVGDSTMLTGPINFQTNSVLPPPYDDLCNSAQLTVNDDFALYTTEGSTNEINLGEVAGSCYGVTGLLESSWFHFTAPASGEVTVSTDLDNTALHDTHIAIFELNGDCTDLSNLTEIGCDEDGGEAEPSGFTSVVELTGLTEGTAYYIQVDGWDGQDGEFGIRVFENVISVEEFYSNGFELFPNPAKDQVTIKSGSLNGMVDIEIFDMNGRRSFADRRSLEAVRPVIMDISTLDAGVYTIRVMNQDGFSVQRLIVE